MAREERAKHMQVSDSRCGLGLPACVTNLCMCVQMYPGWSARDNYAVHKKRRKRKVKQQGGGMGDGKSDIPEENSKSPQKMGMV